MKHHKEWFQLKRSARKSTYAQSGRARWSMVRDVVHHTHEESALGAQEKNEPGEEQIWQMGTAKKTLPEKGLPSNHMYPRVWLVHASYGLTSPSSSAAASLPPFVALPSRSLFIDCSSTFERSPLHRCAHHNGPNSGDCSHVLDPAAPYLGKISRSGYPWGAGERLPCA